MDDERIGAGDTETDPFEHGAVIEPFCCGLWDGVAYHHWWGDDCHERMAKHMLAETEPITVYFHNGGRFDFTFLLPWLSPDVMIINNRIVKCNIGKVELRDSFAILPVPLKTAADKGEIDYMKMRRAVRDRHRFEILRYLKRDCLELHKAVIAYRERFGSKVTMASAAMRKLEEFVEKETGSKARDVLERLTLQRDAEIRKWYFGGRVQAFEYGVLNGPWEVIDRVSMYPAAMAEYEHPVSRQWREGGHIDECDFAVVEATSRGAFPFRLRDGSLDFPHGRGVFHVTGHELRAARELGLCDIHSAQRTLTFARHMRFTGFVEHYSGLRVMARRDGDTDGVLHYKLVQNSCYGRWSLNPEKLFNWMVLPLGEEPANDNDYPWIASSVGATHVFWRQPVSDHRKRQSIRNVATGASITGAARADLLRASMACERLIYCDTDSLICRSHTLPLGDTLGCWKHEGTADIAAIAGKKLYALFADGKEMKKASKGARLTADEIMRVARGEVIEWMNDKPTMGLAGQQKYMKRKVQIR